MSEWRTFLFTVIFDYASNFSPTSPPRGTAAIYDGINLVVPIVIKLLDSYLA